MGQIDHRMNAQKKIVVIAGPNGAGKTSFAREFLPKEAGCPVFVYADLIAAGIAPFQPESVPFHAGRLMLGEIAAHIAAGRNFAFETTLAGRTYAPMIDRWRADGYSVKLIFLSLASPRRQSPAWPCACARVGIMFPPKRSAGGSSLVWHIFATPIERGSISGSCSTIAASTCS